MKPQANVYLRGAGCAVGLFMIATGCAQRMTVSTGTIIGLNATPGDGQTQAPQVTLAYKRSELAFVPTGERLAKKGPPIDTDAYSALAIIDFKTRWFRGTQIDQFIATGHAARDIQDSPQFTGALLSGVYSEPSSEIVKRRNALAAKIHALWMQKPPEEQNQFAKALLMHAGYPDVQQPATNILQRALEDVRTDEAMKDFESAFTRLP